jgi:hypothetical protein
LAGAREKFDEQPEEQMPRNANPESSAGEPDVASWTEQKKDIGKDPLLWISGIFAVAALLACLILPIWVFVTGGSRYEQNFATFKNILIWPTLIYFVAGTIWAVKRNKAK